MNRNDFQVLADQRVKEARVLMDHGCYDGAYYLLGYSVECALKSCIAKQIKEHDFPDRKFISDSYTHELDKLLNLVGSLDGEEKTLKNRLEEDEEVSLNWAVVKAWSEKSRYEYGMSSSEVRDMYNAITSERTGILSWLKNWW